MNDRDELRQSLLELHYDLLDEPAAAKLRAAIASDPDIAAEWAAALRLAGQLADAAKIEGAKLLSGGTTPAPTLNNVVERQAAAEQNGRLKPIKGELVRPSEKELVRPDSSDLAIGAAGATSAATTAAPEATLTADASSSADGNVRRRRLSSGQWWIHSSVIAATAAMIGLFVIGGTYLRRIESVSPDAIVRLEAQPVPTPDSASEREFRFVTRRVDPAVTNDVFSVTPASISFSVLAHGSVLFRGSATTDDHGAASVSLPDDLLIPEGALMRITASTSEPGVRAGSIDVPLEPTRCLTYLKVDRPVYRPGETVFFRSLTLTRKSLRSNLVVPIRYELLDPSGTLVSGAFTEGVTDRGVGNGAFAIASSAPGGAYTLVAKSLDGFFPEERCEFQVRRYRVPRFKKELEFGRRSYGPGETVEADFSAARAEGGALAGAMLKIVAKVDDVVVHRSTDVCSATGTCHITFPLPEHIGDGNGTLSVTVDDGGTQETQSKTIPIQLGRVDVDFYPEGGYLVDNLKNRVYFAARDKLGNPIHLAGEIQDRSGQKVAEIETVRDGMGRFEFIPRRGERYTLKVTKPVDITSAPRLPAVVRDLPVIDSGSGVFAASAPLTLTVRSNSKRRVLIRAVCRGQLVAEKRRRLSVGDNPVPLQVREDAGGVIRVTVLDADSTPARPLVERLVFRRHKKALQVEILETDLQRSPGEPLRLTLQVRDEAGEPTPAVLGVAVVDDAALSLSETERPTLRTHFLLTSEVEKPEDLEHANFYLSDDPEAGDALDLLLGTQGWRRFVSGAPGQADADFRQQLIRLLELDGNDRQQALPRRYDSSADYRGEWERYREVATTAWQQVVFQAQLLVLAVCLIWLAALLVRLRDNARVGVASILLIATTIPLIYGCGAPESQILDSRAGSIASEEESAWQETSGTDMDRSMLEPTDNARIEAEMLAIDEAPPMEKPAPAAPPPSSDAKQDFRRGAPPPTPLRSRSQNEKDVASLLDVASSDEIATPGNLSRMAASMPRSLTSEQLEQLLSARGLDAEALAEQLLDELRFPIRQYAHQHPQTKSDVRQDFAETLLWQPFLITDSNGQATIRFDLSDSVTSFRITADGHSAGGRIGSGDSAIVSRLPFQIEPKLPLEVTTGDRIDLPVAIINATKQPLSVGVAVRADDSLKPISEPTQTLQLNPQQRKREQFSLSVLNGAAETDATIQISGSAGSLSDSVRRSLHISPAGYPARRSLAGVLDQRTKIKLPVPKEIVDGSLAVTLRAYPSPLADVMSGVESILREPHGCFEQTSATNYPNTMALLYMQRNDIANPDVTRKARAMLNRGHDKLISFECEKRGYEWFGHDPGHEALSAFGLMQFQDMSQVMDISGEMLTRTRQWLMGRRDGKGGFKRNPRHLHVWSVKQPIVNAYVLWALTEADVATGHDRRADSELSAELDQLERVAGDSDDAYLIGLSAAALLNVKRSEAGEALLQKLAGMQAEDGGADRKDNGHLQRRHFTARRNDCDRCAGLAQESPLSAASARGDEVAHRQPTRQCRLWIHPGNRARPQSLGSHGRSHSSVGRRGPDRLASR